MQQPQSLSWLARWFYVKKESDQSKSQDLDEATRGFNKLIKDTYLRVEHVNYVSFHLLTSL